jgi:hypothetical protein
MAKIRFDANVPVEIALKFEAGKRVPSTLKDKEGNPLPDQMFYTLCGDDTMYVSLAVADQITKLGIRKMELFSICKSVRNQVTRWEVKRVGDSGTAPIAPATPVRSEEAPPPPTWDEMDTWEEIPSNLEATLEASVRLQQQRNALTPSKVSPSAAAVATLPQTLSKVGAPQNDSTLQPIAHTAMSRIMASALIAAFDATQECERYAHSKGSDFEFTSEDIRAISNTIFIQLSKDPGAFVNVAGTPQYAQRIGSRQ